MTKPRRFPPPWDIEEYNRSCYIVRDGKGQALAYLYFEAEPGRRTAAGLLTRDEARAFHGLMELGGISRREADCDLRAGWNWGPASDGCGSKKTLFALEQARADIARRRR